MAAGALRSRVGFYVRSITDDGAGNVEGEYGDNPDFTVSANIAPRLGGEGVIAGRLAGKNLVNITVRKSSKTVQVTDAWKAKDQDDVEYNIRSIIDPQQGTARHGMWLEMLCEVGVAV